MHTPEGRRRIREMMGRTKAPSTKTRTPSPKAAQSTNRFSMLDWLGQLGRKADHRTQEGAVQLDLEQEWDRQINEFLGLKFNEQPKVDQTVGQYRASFPKFLPQPLSYEGNFDIPLLFEGRIDSKRKLELAGYEDLYPDAEIVNDVDISDRPYSAWLRDPRKYNGRMTIPEQVANLTTLEVASPVIEVVDAFILRPDFFDEGHALVAAISHFKGMEGYLYLAADQGLGRVYRGYLKHPVLSRGKDIRL